MQMNKKLLEAVLTADDNYLLDVLHDFLKAYDYDVIRDADKDFYVVGIPKGEIETRIALVAHVDTVKPKSQGYDLMWMKDCVMNRAGILGADDRAGVYSIMHIVAHSTIKPIVVFTNYEEVGGIGVGLLCEDGVLDSYVRDIDFFIELDRKGADEYVYYSDYLPYSYEVFVETFGFQPNWGSYSDVADITETYMIPHVNLSIGYYGQHTKNEYLNTREMMQTIKRVMAMLLVKTPELEVIKPWYSDKKLSGKRDFMKYANKSTPTSAGTSKKSKKKNKQTTAVQVYNQKTDVANLYMSYDGVYYAKQEDGSWAEIRLSEDDYATRPDDPRSYHPTTGVRSKLPPADDREDYENEYMEIQRAAEAYDEYVLSKRGYTARFDEDDCYIVDEYQDNFIEFCRTHYEDDAAVGGKKV